MGLKRGNPAIPVGKIRFSSDQAEGWTETYNLIGSSYLEAHTNFAPIISWRHVTLANGVTISGWSISDSNSKNDGYMSESNVDQTGYTISTDTGSPVAREYYNNIGDALKVRFATGSDAAHPTGHGLTYLFRGVRDSWVYDEATLSTLVGKVDITYTPSTLGNGLTPAQVWKSFLYWVLVGTVKVKNDPTAVPDPTNTLENLTRAYTKAYGVTRDTGRDPSAPKGRIRRQMV